MTIQVRKYRVGEEAELWNLFFNTVHTINSCDYSNKQIRAWAPEDVDRESWRTQIEGLDPFVCVHDGVIVGYADLQDGGYIDHFFVHHRWQRKGVGTRLLVAIESDARARAFHQLRADVSITARPFFEAQGFHVLVQQEISVRTAVLTNFKMIKQLSSIL